MKPVDQIYSLILETASQKRQGKDEAEDMWRALATIICLRRPLPVSNLVALLGMSTRRLQTALAGVHSVVEVPNNASQNVSTFHASLADYLTDTSRSGNDPWHVDIPTTEGDVAAACLQVMTTQLTFNICQWETSCLPNDRQNFLTPGDHLVYACQHWTDHWLKAANVAQLTSEVIRFFQWQFLYWLEVMSAMKLVDDVKPKLLKIVTSCRDVSQLVFPNFYLNDIRTVRTFDGKADASSKRRNRFH
jgi:hypothetical protein